MTRTWLRTGLATALMAGALATPNLLTTATPALAATLAEDPDRLSAAGTGWYYYYGQTPAQISSLASGKRVVDVEVAAVSGALPTFDVVLVSNAGSFARPGSGFAAGLTAAQVSSTVGTTRRLVDLERYVTSDGVRYAVSYLDNTGVAQKTSGYFLASSAAQVNSLLGSTRRATDLEGFTSGSTTLFSGIWINNSGVDNRANCRYYGITSSALTTSLASGGACAGHRVLSFKRRGTVFDVLTVAPRGGERWYYYYGQSATSVSNLLSQLGTRLYELRRTPTGTFDVAMVNNLSGESLRVRNLVASGMAQSSSWGFSVKRVGGSTIAALQSDRQFEPASMIKVLLHLKFHKEDAASDSVNLGTRMDWYKNPDRTAENEGDGPNTCPDYAEDGTTAVRTSTRQVDYGMMWDSDNRLTRGMMKRYGLTAINQLATDLGMTRTVLQQDRIGCGTDGDKRNFLTLRDAGTLYEKVRNGTALPSAFRPQFEDLMINGTASFLTSIVSEEAAKLGDVTAAEQQAFIAASRIIAKGGSYDTCAIPVANCATAKIYTRTDGGMVTLPAKTTAGVIAPVDYVYGVFQEGTCTTSYSDCDSKANASAPSLSKALRESFRTQVASALANW